MEFRKKKKKESTAIRLMFHLSSIARLKLVYCMCLAERWHLMSQGLDFLQLYCTIRMSVFTLALNSFKGGTDKGSYRERGVFLIVG